MDANCDQLLALVFLTTAKALHRLRPVLKLSAAQRVLIVLVVKVQGVADLPVGAQATMVPKFREGVLLLVHGEKDHGAQFGARRLPDKRPHVGVDLADWIGRLRQGA